MIYLDANAYYWYYGRNRLLGLSSSASNVNEEELCTFLDNRRDKSVPASVFMEIITHFRDKPYILSDIMQFRENKGLKIYNNIREYSFTPEELSCYSVMSNDDLIKYADKILHKKIDIETAFSYVFLNSIWLLYSNYQLDCSSLDMGTKNNILCFFKQLEEDNREDYCNQIKDILQKGYDDDSAAQFLKKKYIELLNQSCLYTHMIIDSINNLNKNTDVLDVMGNAVKSARAGGLDGNNTMSTISNDLLNDVSFLTYAENKIANIFLKKGYLLHQTRYMKKMLRAWLERGQKLRKNDIFDMLCVGALDKSEIDKKASILVDQSSYIITFDGTMMDFIKEVKPDNEKLINRFLI